MFEPSLKEKLAAIRKIAIENAIPFRFIEKIINNFEVGGYGKRSVDKRFKFFKVNLTIFQGFLKI